MSPSVPEVPPSPRDQRAATPLTVRSEDLLQGQREIHILHGEEIYRLLVTRNGKLILQK